MSNLIQRGRATLVRELAAAAGVSSLSYRQVVTGNTVTLDSQAWVGNNAWRSQLDGAHTLEYGDRDYLIPAEYLVFAATTFEPQRGDRITETLNGVVEVYEIISPDNGEPAWRWSDPQHTIYRVHTKQVS